MPQQTINIGAAPNDDTGDPIRTAYDKCNDNFDELYASVAAAATTAYVDGKVNGLSWKLQVRAATTAAGTLASSFENGDTIDGVVLATGDRILIKNQAAPAENGIYVVAASGAPVRASDADSSAELVNASVYVSEGTTLADTQWTCTTNAPITVNTTALTWVQASAGTVSFATTAEFLAGTDTTKAVNSATAAAAGALVALTNSGTDIITTGDAAPDNAKFINAKITMGGNWTLPNFSNPKEGRTGVLKFVQDGTGSRVLSYGSDFRFEGGNNIVLSTAAGAIDLIYYQVLDGGLVFLSAQKAIAA